MTSFKSSRDVLDISKVDTLLQKESYEHIPTINVTDFAVCTLSLDGHIQRILDWADARLSKVVCVANVHMLMEGHWHPDFATVLSKADMLTPDGMPLAWMVRWLKLNHQDRVAGMDVLTCLCEESESRPVSFFFLGSKPETLSRIRTRINAQYPNVRIAGMLSPPFRKLNLDENRSIIKQINESNAGIVLVSFGCPKQERWMYQNKGKVNAVMIGLGGAFSVFAGEVKWAPRFVRELGLEWLYRLVQEPGRLWKRYITTIPPFVYLALKQMVIGGR